jgi:hypothetical protein
MMNSKTTDTGKYTFEWKPCYCPDTHCRLNEDDFVLPEGSVCEADDFFKPKDKPRYRIFFHYSKVGVWVHRVVPVLWCVEDGEYPFGRDSREGLLSFPWIGI